MNETQSESFSTMFHLYWRNNASAWTVTQSIYIFNESKKSEER